MMPTLAQTAPVRPRAVFSQQDFALLRKTVQAYLQQHPGEPDAGRLASLYHRLGRID